MPQVNPSRSARVLAAVVAALALTGVTAGYAAIEIVSSTYSGFLEARTDGANDTAERWIADRKTEVEAFATHPAMAAFAATLAAEASRAARGDAVRAHLSDTFASLVRAKHIEDAFLLAPDMTVLGAIRQDRVGPMAPHPAPTGAVPAFATDAPSVRTTVTPDGRIDFYSAAPVRDASGEVVAILVLQVPAETSLFPLVAGPSNERVTTYVLGRDGRVLLATATASFDTFGLGRFATATDGASLIDPVTLMLERGGSGASLGTFDSSVGPLLGAWQWIDSLGVGVLVTMPKAVLMQLVMKAWLLVASVVLVSMGAAAAVWVVATRLSCKLRIERNLFAAAIETTPDAYMVIDSVGRVSQVNASFTGVFGWKRDEIRGLPAESLLDLIEDDGEDGNRKIRLADIAPDVLVHAVARTRGDAHLPVGLRVQALPAIGGRLVVLHDHRPVVEREEKLQEALEQANAASEAKSRFLSTVSHELRSPAAGVVAALELVGEDLAGTEHQDLLDQTQRSSRLLLGVVEDILDFSSMEAGKFELRSESVDLSHVLADVCEVLGWQARNAKVRLEACYDPSLPLLVGDGLRLRQILLNLVGNAIKFSSKTGRPGEVAIKISGARDDGNRIFIELKVRDNGIGMSGETLNRIFLPFEQADTSIRRRYGGTGLGLSITQRIVAEMKGHISVRSEPGVGSEFTVHLALAPDTARQSDGAGDKAAGDQTATAKTEAGRTLAAPSATAGGTGAVSSHPNSRLRYRPALADPGSRAAVRQLFQLIGEIMPDGLTTFDLSVLLVDDDDLQREIIARRLARLGCRVTQAEDGSAGWELWQQERFDLVISDCHMPVMDGFQLARQIRDREAALSDGRRVHFVALSADITEAAKERSMVAGIDEFLIKPASAAQIMGVVSRHH